MDFSKNKPDFITALMQTWLIQYKQDQINPVTTIGLFHWGFRPNKRNPEKPRRIPIIDESLELKDLSFTHAIYFLEIDYKTLHVYVSSGISLGGLNIAHEYISEEEMFIKGKVLMKMIR
tara:strand:+ start:303 stop:659 length:357 start_codon:yes stop_codon:yes gene_type:complete